MHSLTCPYCGQEVSGPVEASVTEAMERHYAKRGHGSKAKPAKRGASNANKD